MIRTLCNRLILASIIAIMAAQPVLAEPASSFLDFNENNIYNYRPVPFNDSSGCTPSGISELAGHKLPAVKGGTGYEEEINSRGQVKSRWGTSTGFVTFAENVQNAPTDPLSVLPGTPSLQQLYMDYYITMRWRYVTWNWNGSDAPKVDPKEDRTWYEGGNGTDLQRAINAPRVLVRNPETNKSIIAVVLETGPAPWTGVDTRPNNDPKQGWTNPQDGTPDTYKGRVSGFPPKAIAALGATQRMQDGSGVELEYSWAPDQHAFPGPVQSESNSKTAGATCEGGTVVIDGLTYAFPVEPQTQRNYSTLPCPRENGCHHDGTPAFDLMFGKVGTMDAKDVYAITDGKVVTVTKPYVMGDASLSDSNPECSALQFQATEAYSLNATHNAKYGGNVTSGKKYFWYGHIKNVLVKPEDGEVKAGTKIAEVADYSFGWGCRGGRDHLHIDQGCLGGSSVYYQWLRGGRDSCRHKGFITLMNDMLKMLKPPAGSEE